jgi:hypothetical protein
MQQTQTLVMQSKFAVPAIGNGRNQDKMVNFFNAGKVDGI